METTEPPFAERRLMAGLHMASRRVAASIDRAIAEHGVSLRSLMLLGLLDELGDRSQQAVGMTLGIDRTTMVGLVDELERSGLVERHRRPEDRRQYALRITPKGRRTRERLELAADAAEARLLEGLSAQEVAALRAGLAHLASCGDPPPPCGGSPDGSG